MTQPYKYDFKKLQNSYELSSVYYYVRQFSLFRFGFELILLTSNCVDFLRYTPMGSEMRIHHFGILRL